MAGDNSEEANFTNIVVGSLATTLVLLLILPMIFVAGKATYYSAYTDDGSGQVGALAQVTDMRESTGGGSSPSHRYARIDGRR